MGKHFPVMYDEILSSLDIKSDGTYVDLTLGRGGHSKGILDNLEHGQLFSFDKDKQAIFESEPYLREANTNFKLIHSDFKNFKSELNKLGITKVDGIIADLGMSSPQIDQADRGFSYNKESRLDMRMNQAQKLDAEQIVNEYTENELVAIFRNYADVMLPQRVAKGIISNRPVKTTLQLVDIIKNSLPAAIVRKKNPAKAVFQSLRIAVNNELDSLEEMLKSSLSLLSKDGVLAIITFHSIEDRIVKKFFQNLIKDDTGKLPIIIEKKYKAKIIRPSDSEIKINSRSRSAKLRILKKLRD